MILSLARAISLLAVGKAASMSFFLNSMAFNKGVPGVPFGTPAWRPAPTSPAASRSASLIPFLYDGYSDAAHTLPGDGRGSPATLKVTRNLTTNPLPSGCTGNGGAGDDIYVFPSAQQINNEIPTSRVPTRPALPFGTDA